MRSISLSFLLTTLSVFTGSVVQAVPESIYDLPSNNVAIQGRRYEMTNSALLTAGYMPTDSFNRGISMSGAFRHAFTSYLMIEASATSVANQKTSLEGDLSRAGVRPEDVGMGSAVDYPKQIYLLSLHYSPLYSKSLFFNSKLIYSETSFSFGIGAINLNQSGNKVMSAPGIATRVYLGPKTAIIGYLRDYFYSDTGRGITSVIDIGIGLEYKFGGERSPDASRVGT